MQQGRSNEGYGYTGYVATSRAYATNGLNQYTTAGAASLGYDADGKLWWRWPTRTGSPRHRPQRRAT